ncbi:MAG: substrate-binding domain-containing protein [Miniphocaeibacter sp.]|uniref:substrate-binding domain-containing protein n=1 Tax=Miniphocaeibacter sp. TaxID=3100973 RepID=UPI001797870A|nr:substrate-binding domain-containing protein [Gallicola sp.]
MKRKFFIKVISLMLVSVLLVGCSGGTNKTEETGAVSDKSNNDKQIVVGVSLLNNAHVFYNNIEKALQEKAKELGYELIIQDAAGDANKQLGQVQDFITQKVDAIIISPTNSAGSKSMVELADAEDIPVFTMDVASDGEVIAHVATDNYKGGELAAEYIVKNVLEDEKGEVAVITYSEIESTVERENGFTEWIEKNAPNVKVVDIQNYSGDQGKAADVMQNMLLKHENLNAVFCVGDPAAVGAMSSIDSSGKDVKIVGFDGNPEGVEAILSGGKWVADVAQNPEEIGFSTLEAVKSHLAGEEVDKLIPIAPYIIDSSNAEG